MKPFLKIHSCEKMPESMFVAKQDGLEWCLYACLLSGEYGDYQLKHKANHINACPFCGQLLEPQTEQGGVKEVKRPAKAGEWIKIVAPYITDGLYDKGDIIQVKESYPRDRLHVPHIKATIDRHDFKVNESEYVVLDGYKPEPESTAHTTVNNVTIDAKCTSCRRERINEAICTPKLDPNQILDEIERILETIRI